MNRRNFIGGLLTIGAAFTILPGAGRIWTPNRNLVLATVAGIWDTHRITRCDNPPTIPGKFGEVKTFGGDLFYHSNTQWHKLVRMKQAFSQQGYAPLDRETSMDMQRLSFRHELESRRELYSTVRMA